MHTQFKKIPEAVQAEAVVLSIIVKMLQSVAKFRPNIRLNFVDTGQMRLITTENSC